MATFSINSVNVSGKSIRISNGRVLVDGNDLTPESKNIVISVTGDVDSVHVDNCDKLEIKGNVSGDVKTLSGDIKCSNIVGNAETMSGDIKANRIYGSTKSMSGDISCNQKG